MKRILYICFCCVLSMLLTGCIHDGEADKSITDAEQLLNTNPDSSLFILDNIREDKSTWSRSQQMRYELVYAQAQNKAFVNFTTDSIALVLVDYYNRHGNANEQMMANYMAGCAYRDLGSAPKALEAYRDAVESADTTDVECDFRQLMLIHSQMANVYSTLYAADYEERELDNAIRYAAIIQDKKRINVFNNLKCGILQESNKYNDCIRLVDSLRQVYIQREDYYSANAVCLYGVKSYLSLEKYDSALVYLDNYAKIFNTDVSIRKIRGGEDALYILKGRYYLGTSNPDSALHCFKKVDLHNLEPIIRVFVYKKLSDSYKMLSQTDSAYKYLALHAELMDKCYDSSVAEVCINAQQLYNYGIEQKIAKQKSAEASMLKTYLIWTLIGIIILFSLTVYIRYRKLLAQKEAADLRIAHNKAMATLRSAEEQLNILTSQKEEVEKLLLEETIKSSQYNDELSSINQEILAKSAEIDQLNNIIAQLEKTIEEVRLFKTDTDKFIKEKEEEILKLQKSLSLYQGNSLNLEQWEDEREFLSCDLVNHFHDMSSRTQMATATELDKLLDIAQKAFPKLYSTVTDSSHGLSQTEIIICVLIRFRFIPSEISILLGHSSQRITNLKSSINQKLFGTSGAKTLDAHLIALK